MVEGKRYGWLQKVPRTIDKASYIYPQGRWLEVTIAPHFCLLDELEGYIERELFVWNSLDFDKYLIKGWILVTENSMTRLGHVHPHLHVLLFIDHRYFDVGKTVITSGWEKEYVQRLGNYRNCDNEHIVIEEKPSRRGAMGWFQYMWKKDNHVQGFEKVIQSGGLLKDIMDTEYERFGRLDQVKETIQEAPQAPSIEREFGKPSADMMARIAKATGQNDPPRRTLITPEQELLMDWEDTVA